MLYEELHRRYGNHIAKRVQQGLTRAEFDTVTLDELLAYLVDRAEAAHKEYQAHIDDPKKLGAGHNNHTDSLYRRWSEADDLAYLVTIAEDVSNSTHATI